MKLPSRALFLSLIFLLAASLVGCIHYVPREEESTTSTEEAFFAESTVDTADTSTEAEKDSTTEEPTDSSEPDTEYPNEPDDEHSKRY